MRRQWIAWCVWAVSLWCITGCASTTMVNPRVLDGGEVFVSAEANTLARQSPARLSAQAGVGVGVGLELRGMAGITPFRHYSEYYDRAEWISTSYGGGVAYGHELSEKYALKFSLDYSTHTNFYEASRLAFGSWGILDPYIATSAHDGRSRHVHGLSLLSVDRVERLAPYLGLGVLYSDHDITTYGTDFVDDEEIYGIRSRDQYNTLTMPAVFGAQLRVSPNVMLQGDFVFRIPLRHEINLPRHGVLSDLMQVNVGITFYHDFRR